MMPAFAVGLRLRLALQVQEVFKLEPEEGARSVGSLVLGGKSGDKIFLACGQTIKVLDPHRSPQRLAHTVGGVAQGDNPCARILLTANPGFIPWEPLPSIGLQGNLVAT